MTEEQERQVAVREARSWVGTPYLLKAHVKGRNGGNDCGSFPMEVFIAAGKLRREDVARVMAEEFPYLAPDWFNFASEEKYLRVLLKLTAKILATRCYASVKILPGDIVVTKAFGVSKRFNHCGVVVAWPRIVHAVSPRTREVDASRDPMWCHQAIEVYSFWRTT